MADVTTTTVNPSESTLSPNFADYIYRMLGRGEQAAALPFQEYTGQRYAGIQPLLQEAFQRAPGLGGESFTSSGIASKYMSPYFQQALEPQLRETTRQADIARTSRGARYAQAGAFGGSRQAIEEAEADRNLQQRLGDIQATGIQQAYQSAQDQFNREQAARLQGIGQLATLGQQQQQLAQQPLDFGYQQFQQSLQYPFQQATYMQSLLGGLPLAARPYDSGTSAFGGALQGLALGAALTGGFKP